MIHTDKFIPSAAGTGRYILVANTGSIALHKLAILPGGPLTDDDIIIEFNKARHHADLLAWENAHNIHPRHFLIVRNQGSSNWHAPASFDGFHFVYFPPIHGCLADFAFYRRYKTATNGKVPTSGFAIWNVLKEGYPNTRTLLFGFDPAGDASSFKSDMHAWEYEAMVYKRQHAELV